ncbi:MAG: glutamate-1-semialdehyde 2,1-aminomutase [Chromatiales bacterium]|nr:glutamate-1-semialdehyde 2,1-aminomutase [Chromatiales bacterium]
MKRSTTLYRRACLAIPGGVNSPVRAFKAVGGTPPFIKEARGAWLTDEDGNQYIDYVGSWGAMIMGHAHPEVLTAVKQTAERGLGFGASTEIETQLAEKIKAYIPSMDLLRLVNSGSEAVMSAVRLARGYTGREQIIKFDGCYHGHSDAMLVGAGSGSLTLGVPNSPGVPDSTAAATSTIGYNNAAQVDEVFEQIGDQVAAVIVEPVAGNMNFVPGNAEFLSTLRRCCDHYGTLLIFDEVMSGFRVAIGGAQSVYQIKPDLTVLGKVIGGGLPIGAFGGSKKIMQHIAPLGPVYQAGTLSGNPVAVAAGLRTLELLCADNCFDDIVRNTQTLIGGLLDCARDVGVDFYSDSMGAMFGFFLGTTQKVETLNQVRSCVTKDNGKPFKSFFHAMLDGGVYLPPSPFEACFISAAHDAEVIEQTIDVTKKALLKIKN